MRSTKLFFLLVFLFAQNIWAQEKYNFKKISANDSLLIIKGASNLVSNKDSIIINRFSTGFLDKAKDCVSSNNAHTQSGVIIQFKTLSPVIKLNFSARADASNRELIFAVYKNKNFVSYYKSLSFELFNQETDKEANWEIVLPFFYGVHFKGISIIHGYSLQKTENENLMNYLAIGDSITHGVGQKGVASDGTYPFILAQQKNWYLFNVAVSGSKITDLIADETKDFKADVISILWGYNDWNNGISMLAVAEKYEMLISKLRRYHPLAKIYCIMPTFTTSVMPKQPGQNYGIDVLRSTQRKIVQEFIAKGDQNLKLIEGGEITSLSDLKDYVHMNNEGAKRFSATLHPLIN
jgi:lysophospholipase L1-like esterase